AAGVGDLVAAVVAALEEPAHAERMAALDVAEVFGQLKFCVVLTAGDLRAPGIEGPQHEYGGCVRGRKGRRGEEVELKTGFGGEVAAEGPGGGGAQET